jgi:endonuclease YncB( thermonuclease family)
MLGEFGISNGGGCALRAAALALLAAPALFALASLAQAQERGCTAQDATAAAVRSVRDGRSFVLGDGREVRLASIEIPLSTASAATAALAARINDRSVLLRPLASASDCYGRLNMAAFDAHGARASIDVALVAQGLALAAVGDVPCLASLRSAEGAARHGKLGLWNKAENLRADNPAALLAERGGFMVVEGRVLSVRESGGSIYLNFGRRWSEDFTVTILKRNERKLAEAGLKPQRLEGRNVRIRGFIEERGGPWIEVTAAGQVELADGR